MGSPRISDSGLYSTVECLSLDRTCNSFSASGDKDRYLAPELLNGDEPTNESDVYSLSMVIVEVLLILETSSVRVLILFFFRFKLATGKMPFPEFPIHGIFFMVSQGKRPPKPASFEIPGMSPAVWKIAKKCWHEKPKERPDIKDVLQSLENLAAAGACAQACPCLEWN